MSKWSVHKRKCRQNYRDGCRPVWIVVPPDDSFGFEFDTWAEAIAFLNRELVDH